MDLKHKAAEDLAQVRAWSEDSLGYAREHGQRQLVWQLEAVRDGVELEDALLALPSGEHLGGTAWGSARGKTMHKEQRVVEMATAALRRQAQVAAKRTGEPFEEALKAVLETEAGRQLKTLRDGPHRDESAERWQEDMAHKRARERARERSERRGKNGRYGQPLGKASWTRSVESWSCARKASSPACSVSRCLRSHRRLWSGLPPRTEGKPEKGWWRS